jgi:type II secretory pathway pseudopilin PulG
LIAVYVNAAIQGFIGLPRASLEGCREASDVADSEIVLARLRNEKGFGLLELLMAMTMLNIGILALVAAFNSGAIALRRASQTTTATALADAQMELYRAILYTTIGLDATSINATDSTYRSDSVLGGSIANDVTITCTGSPLPTQCVPSRTATGADHRTYRVDSYVTMTTPTNGRAVKLVTIVVRDGNSPYSTLAREQSTFDSSTGS